MLSTSEHKYNYELCNIHYKKNAGCKNFVTAHLNSVQMIHSNNHQSITMCNSTYNYSDST